jgi:hypothetical protein
VHDSLPRLDVGYNLWFLVRAPTRLRTKIHEARSEIPVSMTKYTGFGYETA